MEASARVAGAPILGRSPAATHPRLQVGGLTAPIVSPRPGVLGCLGRRDSGRRSGTTGRLPAVARGCASPSFGSAWRTAAPSGTPPRCAIRSVPGRHGPSRSVDGGRRNSRAPFVVAAQPHVVGNLERPPSGDSTAPGDRVVRRRGRGRGRCRSHGGLAATVRRLGGPCPGTASVSPAGIPDVERAQHRLRLRWR